MSSPRVTFNLTCGKGISELQNLASLRLSSFAESHQMQQKNFDVSPKGCDSDCSETTMAHNRVQPDGVMVITTSYFPSSRGVDSVGVFSCKVPYSVESTLF